MQSENLLHNVLNLAMPVFAFDLLAISRWLPHTWVLEILMGRTGAKTRTRVKTKSVACSSWMTWRPEGGNSHDNVLAAPLSSKEELRLGPKHKDLHACRQFFGWSSPKTREGVF